MRNVLEYVNLWPAKVFVWALKPTALYYMHNNATSVGNKITEQISWGDYSPREKESIHETSSNLRQLFRCSHYSCQFMLYSAIQLYNICKLLAINILNQRICEQLYCPPSTEKQKQYFSAKSYRSSQNFR